MMDPLLLALAAFVVVIAGILWIKLPPFLALILAAFLVALGTAEQQLHNGAIREHGVRIKEVQENRFKGKNVLVGRNLVFRPHGKDLEEVGAGDVSYNEPDEQFVFSGFDLQQGDYLLHPSDRDTVITAAHTSSGSRVAFGFGDTCRKIGLLIAMASVIGCCLLESGAAQRIVEVIRTAFGERRTPLAFAVSGFVVGIPVFFDTVFYLLIPLAKALYAKTQKNYLLYVMSIVVGATMAHSLVPPTPGPLLVAAGLDGVEVVDMMLGGIVVGFFAMASGYAYAVWANKQWNIPLRGDSADSAEPFSLDQAPSFLLSITPIAMPVVLLAARTILGSLNWSDVGWQGLVLRGAEFLGDKNIALSLAAMVALAMLISQKRRSGDETWTKSVEESLRSGGMILLITAAGGAFGHVLRQSGVAEAIQERFPATQSDLAILVLAFFMTAVIRFVQGSATVAMITSVSIVAPLAAGVDLSYHPVYLALAIGCGSKPLPWMNDSGFWIVGRMSGMTEAETLRSFSVTLTIMGVVGFLVTLTGALLLPMSG